MIQEDTMRQLPVSKKDIQIMTEEDSELRELSEIIKKGFWPKVKPGSNWNAFQSKATDLTLHDGILFMGVRAVIPKKLQQRILRMLHQGHPGITRMKMLARQSVYWHGIDRDIESMVKTCDACQKAAKMPIKTRCHHGLNHHRPGREFTLILRDQWRIQCFWLLWTHIQNGQK